MLPLLKRKIKYTSLFFTLFWVYSYCLLKRKVKYTSLYFTLFSFFLILICVWFWWMAILRNFMICEECRDIFLFCSRKRKPIIKFSTVLKGTRIYRWTIFLINFTFKTKESQRSCTNRLQLFSHVNIEKALFFVRHVRGCSICQRLDCVNPCQLCYLSTPKLHWGGRGESDITVLCVMGVVGVDNYFANCLGRRVRLFFYFFREEMQVADVFKLWQNKQLI